MLSHIILARVVTIVGLFVFSPLAVLASDIQDDCHPAAAEGWVAERAVSLRQLQLDLESCGENCPAPPRELYGLGRVDGFAIARPSEDRPNGDIVLFGPAWQPGNPVQLTDSLVVGLRVAAMRYAEVKGNTRYITAPGVTLNSRPETIVTLIRIATEKKTGSDAWLDQYCEACRRAPQDLVVYGIPPDSTAAAAMASADYILKSIASSDLPVPLAGFQSLAAMRRETALADLRAGRAISSSHMTRLWFTAGDVTYKERPDGIALDRSDIVIRQRNQVVMTDGHHHDGGRAEPDVVKWTCQASRKYHEVAAAVPESGWDQLARLMRVFAVARLIVDRPAALESGLDLGYLLDRHVLERVPVKREWEGVAHVEQFEFSTETGRMVRKAVMQMPSCGGVDFDLGHQLTAVPDIDQKLGQGVRGVILSRPASGAPAWQVGS